MEDADVSEEAVELPVAVMTGHVEENRDHRRVLVDVARQRLDYVDAPASVGRVAEVSG